jgi:hypothetical protein
VGADHVSVQQAEGKDQVLAGDAVGVSEEFTGVQRNPQPQPCGVGSGAVVPCQAADEPRQQGMKQPRLGDLWAQQHQDTIAVLGLFHVLGVDLRGRHRAAEEAVQPCSHPSAGWVASLQAAESLNVECEHGPMFRFCAHGLPCLL